MTLYDTLIVGGGPAGLTAAIHLAWHDRKVLVIDRVTGPLFFTLDMTQQVAVAMGTGNIAAVMIDQHLRKQDID